MLTNTGAKTTTDTTSRRGVVDVVPNIVFSAGASATIGMTDRAAAVGDRSVSAIRLRAATIAAPTATTLPTTSPTSTFMPGGQRRGPDQRQDQHGAARRSPSGSAAGTA